MKLWIKVFIVTLMLVVVATSIASIITVGQSRHIMIEQEKDDSVKIQEKIMDNIGNQIILTKTNNDKIILLEDELHQIIEECVTEAEPNLSGVAVLDIENKWGYHNNLEIEKYRELINKVTDGNKELLYIDSSGETVKIICVSQFNADGDYFFILTERDISDLYGEWEGQIETLHWINFIVAAFVSAVVILLISILISPLSRINNGLTEITKGNYEYSIIESGSYEFKKVSHNINILTKSVSDNVEKIQSIAEGRKTFIDNFAHEMKTPLTSIIGFSNLLSINNKDITESKRIQYATIIEHEASRLKNLSTKLLELSVSEQVQLDFSEVNVHDLFSEVQSIMHPTLVKKKCILQIQHGNELLYIDKELFKSLLYNLVDNAIKASEKNSKIILKCEENEKQIVISVTDNGIGMSEDEIKKVTEPFYMVDKSRSRRENGVGLGLYLCTEIVKQHQAFMNIESTPGRGTTVYVFMSSGRKYEKA